jgi:hypothetical protein
MAAAWVGSLTKKEKIVGEKKDTEQSPETKEATAHASKLARYRHTAVATLGRSRKQTKVSNSGAMLPAENLTTTRHLIRAMARAPPLVEHSFNSTRSKNMIAQYPPQTGGENS